MLRLAVPTRPLTVVTGKASRIAEMPYCCADAASCCVGEYKRWSKGDGNLSSCCFAAEKAGMERARGRDNRAASVLWSENHMPKREYLVPYAFISLVYGVEYTA